jgi:hypothetical protein
LDVACIVAAPPSFNGKQIIITSRIKLRRGRTTSLCRLPGSSISLYFATDASLALSLHFSHSIQSCKKTHLSGPVFARNAGPNEQGS